MYYLSILITVLAAVTTAQRLTPTPRSSPATPTKQPVSPSATPQYINSEDPELKDKPACRFVRGQAVNMPCIATKGEEQALFAPVNAAPSSPPSSAAPGHQPVNPSAATEEPAGPEQTTVPDDRFKDKPACRFEGEQAVNLPCIVTEGDVQLLLQTAAEDDGEEEERDSPNKNPLNIPLWLAVGRVEQLKKDMQYISNDLKGSEVTDNEYVDGAKARIEAALESKGGYEDNAEIERILDKMDDNDDRLGDDS